LTGVELASIFDIIIKRFIKEARNTRGCFLSGRTLLNLRDSFKFTHLEECKGNQQSPTEEREMRGIKNE